MKPATLLLIEFSLVAELGEVLRSQLSATEVAPAVIHQKCFHGVDMATTPRRLQEAVSTIRPDLLILVLSSDAHLAAAGIFRALFSQARPPAIVVVPSRDEPQEINELLQLGASDYLVPPFRPVDVVPRIKRLLAYPLPRTMPLSKVRESSGLQHFVGESSSLLEQFRRIPLAAGCDACVLITGETGTGKEVCARAIHQVSLRSGHPFIPLDCGAIPVDLVENELFGHEPGAFTSANARQAGVVQEANNGTLFLDEIDSLPLAAQIKLLRFLQSKEYRPLGSSKPCKADVRIIAASNACIEELLRAGKMRQDLFYRLNVLRLHLPPLRERKEDIPLLARHFLAKYAAEHDAPIRDINPTALHKLSLWEWPGNVRELENAIQRAVILCSGRVIQSGDIDLPTATDPISMPVSFRELKAGVVASFERNYVRATLEEHGGNIAGAARAAKKNRRVFFHLMRKHHIRIERIPDASGAKPMVKIVIDLDKNVQPAKHP